MKLYEGGYSTEIICPVCGYPDASFSYDNSGEFMGDTTSCDVCGFFYV